MNISVSIYIISIRKRVIVMIILLIIIYASFLFCSFISIIPTFLFSDFHIFKHINVWHVRKINYFTVIHNSSHNSNGNNIRRSPSNCTFINITISKYGLISDSQNYSTTFRNFVKAMKNFDPRQVICMIFSTQVYITNQIYSNQTDS